jgi:two-component system CheB/CheR fusion protein
MDINDRRMASEELEKRIEERTLELKLKNDELERSNRELASFSYVASHDLQEPLRKIITFADRLQGQYKEELPKGAIEYLDKMVVSSKRMTRLIEDLLNFSRVSRSAEKFVWTDLHEVVKNVMMDFDQRIAEKKARISISKLPVISAIPLQMHQLFYNLISNALKFTKSSVAPVIKISYRSLPNHEKAAFPQLEQTIPYCEIKVEDNGIGFDDSFSEQIFTIFQRLHGKSEFSGTGIGLALCRKIAETHNGYIYASSQENKGATFVVLLPADL